MKTLRRRRLYLLKTIALLSQVRWYNILLLATAQYLTGVFVMNDPRQWKHTLLDGSLHLVVLASLFVIAGGFIINNFYDREKDIINRPQQTVFERLVSKGTGLNLYVTFNLVGFLLAYIVSWRAWLFYAVYAFGLWFYSHKLKKITLLGNLAASALSVIPFFGIFFYYDYPGLQLVLYVAMMVVVLFAREMVKDVTGIKGDVMTGYPTVPATVGLRRTGQMVALSLLGVPLLSVVMLPGLNEPVQVLLIIANLMVGITIIGALIAGGPKGFQRVNLLLKVIVIGGVVSLLFFRL